MPAESTTPLLPISSPTAVHSPGPSPQNQQHLEPSSTNRLQRIAIHLFTTVRFLRGVSLITYPRLGLYALDIAPDGSAYMLASMIGIRDVLLSGLLHTADTHDPTAVRELTRALATNLLSDALDAFVLTFYAAWEDDWGNPMGVIVMAAVMAVLEHLTLWSLSENEWNGGDNRSLEDDKKARMNAWLTELERYEDEQGQQSMPPSAHTSIRQYGSMA